MPNCYYRRDAVFRLLDDEYVLWRKCSMMRQADMVMTLSSHKLLQVRLLLRWCHRAHDCWHSTHVLSLMLLSLYMLWCFRQLKAAVPRLQPGLTLAMVPEVSAAEREWL